MPLPGPAFVVPMTAQLLPASTMSSAIKVGSPFSFGVPDSLHDVWTSLKGQDHAVKDKLCEITGDGQMCGHALCRTARATN